MPKINIDLRHRVPSAYIGAEQLHATGDGTMVKPEACINEYIGLLLL